MRTPLQHLLIAALSLVSTVGLCQIPRTALVLEDATGITDTVHFGYVRGATTGLDPAGGEVDLTGIPMGLTEMRFVSTAPRSCFLDSMFSYRTHNYETKRDFRDVIGRGGRPIVGYPYYGNNGNGLVLEDNVYSLKVKCSTPPCTIKTLTSITFQNMFDGILVKSRDSLSWVTNCITSEPDLLDNTFIGMPAQYSFKTIGSTSSSRDTVVYLDIFAYFTYTNLPRTLRQLNLLAINNTLEATDAARLPQQVQVVDAVGRVVSQQPWPANERRCTLPNLSGMHVLRITYADGAVANVKHLFAPSY